jgi:hypothetical protein
MSIELVGFENLPNAYIKEISIFDYKANQIEIKIIIRVHDLEDGLVWFDTSEALSKLLRIGLIISTDESQSQQLTSGEANPVQLISMSRSIPSASESNDNLVFEVSFRKIIPRNTRHLNLYSFCFIDKVQVLEEFGFSMGHDYYGPIKSEKVLNNSNIITNTDVFIQDNGQYWSGPMHQHRGKYMAGSYHTLTPHTMLRKITIPNVKIKDFRGMKGKRSESVDSTKNFLSDLTVSYNSDTDINAMFMLNVKTLLKNNTKYGSFLDRASPTVVSQILQDFKISMMTIQRQRIKPYNQSTRLRSKKETTQSIFSKKNIIKSHDITGILRNSTRLEKHHTHDVVISELRSNTSAPNRQKNEIFAEEVANYKKISMIQELFFQYGEGIRTFQFNDYELTSKTPGKYKYKVDLQFSDPIYSFLSSVSNFMKSDISIIKRYVSLSSRGRDLTISEINPQSLVNSYVNYYSYVYELSQQEIASLSFKMFALMNPKTATTKSVKNFKKKYEDLYSEFLVFLDFDAEKIFSKKQKTSIKSKNATTGRILVGNTFNKIIEPASNSVGFAYLDTSKKSSMKIYTKLDIENRANEETKNNFIEQPSTSSPDFKDSTNTGVNDLATTKTTYYTPSLMGVGKTSFMMGRDANAPYDPLNTGLGAMSPQVSPFAKNTKTLKISDVMVQSPSIPQDPVEETDETYVNSSDIIGSNQTFVSYTNTVDSYNVIESKTGSNQRVNETLTGYQNNRTFRATLAAAKLLSGDEAAMLPNQLKAVISGDSPATRTDYVTSGTDLLADPKTKNYYELNNFSVQELLYIDGFEQDSSNNILLNKPIYKSMLLSNFQLTSKPVVCFLQSYTNNTFNITDENKVSVIDSSFIMSDIDITVKPNNQTTQSQPTYNTQDISYEFMNSNIVKQTNQRMTVKIQQTSDTPQATLETDISVPINLNTNLFGSY